MVRVSCWRACQAAWRLNPSSSCLAIPGFTVATNRRLMRPPWSCGACAARGELTATARHPNNSFRTIRPPTLCIRWIRCREHGWHRALEVSAPAGGRQSPAGSGPVATGLVGFSRSHLLEVFMSLLRSLGIALGLPVAPLLAQTPARFDILITGGRVLDGTGNPWFRADVGIRGDRIAAIGNLRDAPAAKTIDARGMLVTPGFVALHEHIDRGILRGQSVVPNYLLQGFTTAVINADGLEGGIWPLRTQRDSLRKLGHALNLVPMVSHGTVRRLAMGTSPEEVMRPATQDQLTRMRALVRQGMDE